ncbi:unnamed protein product [Urochloa decumbens]|uniref:BHLH domain-containing protein n=1 Tax=Urochloa decumbens TaxID=240449 RepID=A0ABC9DX32_9POAL
MALLEAVAFPPDHPRVVPCCSSCGTSRVLAGYGVAAASAGEFEGIIENGVVAAQEDGEPVLPPAHGGAACCAWAGGGAATSSCCWVAPAPAPTTLATSSSAPRPVRRRRGAAVAARVARRGAAEAESLRQSHIAVERGRRRRVNEYLAALRALMPPSYSRRGDQASIVGGAIDFVKELEHHLQSLQAQKRTASATAGGGHGSERFPGFFTSPQYSAAAAAVDDGASSTCGGGEGRRDTMQPGVADVEAAVSDGGHATVKVLAPRRRRMLLGLLLGMQRRGLAALHLNASTTADQMVLYTFTLKMGDEWQLSSAGDVAAAVHDIVAGMDTAEGRAL